MAFIADRVFDLGLNVLDTEANRLDITSQEATTFSEATVGGTFSLGNKVTAFSIGAPTDRTPDGRKVIVAAITDGDVSDNGTASHWAITDTINSRLLATGSLSATQVVTAGNTFSLDAIDIGIPDA